MTVFLAEVADGLAEVADSLSEVADGRRVRRRSGGLGAGRSFWSRPSVSVRGSLLGGLFFLVVGALLAPRMTVAVESVRGLGPGLIPSAGAASASAAGERSRDASPQTLEALLLGFASMPGFEARFDEEKTLSLLAVPLRSEGRLYFAPPSSLLKDVISPTPQKVLVSESQVRLLTGEREEVIDLAARAEVRPLVESLIWLFTGDRTALESTFRIEFVPGQTGTMGDSEEGGGWTLRLWPKGGPLSQLLTRLVVRGDGQGARRIEVEESSGDRSVMQILEGNPDRRYAAGELESLFRGGATRATEPNPEQDE